MHVNGRSHRVPMSQPSLILRDYLAILWRRKWCFVLALLVGSLVAIAYSTTLPPLYRSLTLILVEPQKVPTSYVSPTITSSVEERLNTISQQIMSWTNLERIIKEFRLYQPEAATSGRHGRLGRMLDQVKQRLAAWGLYEERATVGNAGVTEKVIERMRKDIEVKVMGGKDAFTVAYSGADPQTVMRVTNTLASLFIEKNLQLREQRAEGTTEFLESQLEEAQKKLAEQEIKLKEFQEKHMGSLPGQLEANLRTLDRLQRELQASDEALKGAEERRTLHASQHAFEANLAATLKAQGAPGGAQSRSSLEPLKEELVKLRAVFTDNYPDIVALKKRLSESEAQQNSAASGSAPQQEEASASAGSAAQTKSLRSQEFQAQVQLQTTNSEIAILRERKNKLISQLKEYERRVEDTFNNGQQLSSLTRDYHMSQKHYEALLEKRLNAKISENLEKKQKGEQFRILDSANLPTQPYRPDRPKVILLGSVLSGGLGLGLIFCLEYLNPCFRKPEDFQGSFDVPVLAAISRHKITQKDHQLIVMESPDSTVVEQYRLLYTKIHDVNAAQAHKVFIISSAVQNEGKTVTALNLAIVMARDFGQKVLLLEGDFRRPSLPLYLKAEVEEGLIDILQHKMAMQSTLIPFADTLLPFADEHLAILPAAKKVRNASALLSSHRMKELLEVLKAQYDFVLIDAPPVLPLSDMNIFEKVIDGIVLVVRAESTPRSTLLKAVETLATDKLVALVLNDMRQPFPGSERYYQYEYSKA